MVGLFCSEKPVKNFSDVQRLSQKRFARFFQYLLKEGIYWPPSLFEAAFLSGKHSEQELTRAAKIIGQALTESVGQTQLSD
jgi:glutamate-1-semialdehyde 2,1-aminomutase